MKPKMKWGLIAAVPLALFLVLGRVLAGAFGLSGLAYQAFWIVFTLIGALIGGVIFWFLNKRGPRKKREPDPMEEDLGSRLAEIRRRLAEARRPALQKLPGVLILGDHQCGKSSAVLGSEVAAEQLAGDVRSGQEMPPTKSINAWYSDGTILVEAGNDLRDHASAWTILLQKLRPKKLLAAILTGKPQASRSAVVCFSCDDLRSPGAAEVIQERARAVRSSLMEMARTLGAQIPVYVLFTKADEIPSFEDYAGRLKEGASRQVLGATFPPPSDLEVSTYADRQSRTVGGALESLFRSLSHKRLKYLGPELDPTEAGRLYEFPREFKKLSDNANRFLVELCKPSQLQVSPFLRGFYFVGREETLVEEGDETSPPPEAQDLEPSGGATQVFDLGSLSPNKATPVFSGSRRPGARFQWLFLPRVFRDVILRDPIGSGMMLEGRRVNLGRRLLAGSGAAAVLLLLVLLFRSFLYNSGLQDRVDLAVQELQATGAQGVDSGDLLEKLEAVRAKADTLFAARSESGLSRAVKWVGLNPGRRLYPRVIREYSAIFNPRLLEPALEAITLELGGLPDAPNETSDYDGPYQSLKAYLMVTQSPEHADPGWLADELQSHSSLARGEEARALSLSQFEFFGRSLVRDSTLLRPHPETRVVQHAQTFLRGFGGARPRFRSLVFQINQAFDPVGFGEGRAQPRSMRLASEVQGAFSSSGRDSVKLLVSDPRNLPPPEDWVLGESVSFDQAAMAEGIDSLYEEEYRGQWESLILGASVTRFSGFADAEEKLNELAGDDSPLLSLLGLVYQQTRYTPEVHRARFQPLRAFLALDSTEAIEGLTDRALGYLQALDELEGAMEDLDEASPSERIQVAAGIRDQGVFSAAEEAAQGLRSEMERWQEGRTLASHLSSLIEVPVRQAERLVSAVEPAQLDTWGAEFCREYDDLVGSKFPFDPAATEEPSLDDFAMVFKPGESRFSSLVSDLGSYVERQGYGFVQRGEVGINDAFLTFLTNAYRFSQAIFGQDGERVEVGFQLLPLPNQSYGGIRAIILTTNAGTTSCEARSCLTTDRIVWDGSADMRLSLSVQLAEGDMAIPVSGRTMAEGRWAPFRFFSRTTGWRGPEEIDHTVRWRIPETEGDVAVSVLAGPSSWVFDPAVFRGLRCVPRIVNR
ncbi:MAG: type VI secretion protein IcmF/TssM N-terminal domain-containing protein [Gemmatimonadota bacterium]|jgi:type VI secretion system protein ImpL